MDKFVGSAAPAADRPHAPGSNVFGFNRGPAAKAGADGCAAPMPGNVIPGIPGLLLGVRGAPTEGAPGIEA
jgi:hypothetical protein